MPNVKLDVKQYPVFNGEQASWMKLKRGVLSIASTHGFVDGFDEIKVFPVVGNHDYPLFHEKNKFVYCIWISRVTSGKALSINKKFEIDKDGRGTYLKFLNVYEDK